MLGDRSLEFEESITYKKMNNKLEHIIIKFLNKLYGDLTEYRTDEYPGTVFFIKNKKVFMEHNLENKRLWVDYYTIWSNLKNFFSLEYDDIQSVITKWVEESYNLRDVTPVKQPLYYLL